MWTTKILTRLNWHARIQIVLSEGANVVFVLFSLFVFQLIMGGQRIHITLKADHHKPTNGTPFNNVIDIY